MKPPKMATMAVDMAAPSSSASDADTLTVPLEVLEMDGSNPSEGDEVDAQIQAKVVSIKSGKAVIEITHVNGEPLDDGDQDDDDQDAEPDDSEPSEDDLKSMAAEHDKNATY